MALRDDEELPSSSMLAPWRRKSRSSDSLTCSMEGAVMKAPPVPPVRMTIRPDFSRSAAPPAGRSARPQTSPPAALRGQPVAGPQLAGQDGLSDLFYDRRAHESAHLPEG